MSFPKTSNAIFGENSGHTYHHKDLFSKLLYDQKEALSIADTSIIFEDEKKFVYKILDNNKIKKTEVVTGIRKDGNLEVLEGLNANEKVVKEGLARLADGMTVRPLTK